MIDRIGKEPVASKKSDIEEETILNGHVLEGGVDAYPEPTTEAERDRLFDAIVDGGEGDAAEARLVAGINSEYEVPSAPVVADKLENDEQEKRLEHEADKLYETGRYDTYSQAYEKAREKLGIKQ